MARSAKASLRQATKMVQTCRTRKTQTPMSLFQSSSRPFEEQLLPGLQPERSSRKSHKRRLEPQPDEDYNKRVREAEEDLDRSPTYSPSLIPQQMQEMPEAAPEAEPADERELEALRCQFRKIGT